MVVKVLRLLAWHFRFRLGPAVPYVSHRPVEVRPGLASAPAALLTSRCYQLGCPLVLVQLVHGSSYPVVCMRPSFLLLHRTLHSLHQMRSLQQVRQA